MKKLYVLIITICLFLCSNISALEINSKNAILYNLNDDNIIYEQLSNEKISVASLTKIMTTIVAIENIDNLNDVVTITNNDLKGLEKYAKAGFKVGDKVTYEDLLYGIMLPSGAEAAQAIGNHVGGSMDNFISLMNKKVKELNLKNTHFDNVIGKDSINNYSSVYDVAQILKYALKNETFKKIFETKTYKTTNNLILKSTVITKSNGYNLNSSIITGSKTGYTKDAGLCLASTTNINDVGYLLVTCNAPYKNNYPYQIIDAIDIYEYYSTNYEYKVLIEKDIILENIKVKRSTIKNLEIKSDENIEVYVKKDIDTDKIKYVYNGKKEIDYTYKIGVKIGSIDVVYKDEVLYTYDVIVKEEIKKFPYYIIYISILFIISILYLSRKYIKKKIKKLKKRR